MQVYRLDDFPFLQGLEGCSPGEKPGRPAQQYQLCCAGPSAGFWGPRVPSSVLGVGEMVPNAEVGPGGSPLLQPES